MPLCPFPPPGSYVPVVCSGQLGVHGQSIMEGFHVVILAEEKKYIEMCQLVSNGAFLKTTKLKNRPIKISLRFAVWSQFYQQALINKEIELFWFILGFFQVTNDYFKCHKAGLVQTGKITYLICY